MFGVAVGKIENLLRQKVNANGIIIDFTSFFQRMTSIYLKISIEAPPLYIRMFFSSSLSYYCFITLPPSIFINNIKCTKQRVTKIFLYTEAVVQPIIYTRPIQPITVANQSHLLSDIFTIKIK